ncbi:methyltransferase [Solwaraspora sp. WMMD406]|uniref:methyltransferase n=1 Tax=Solwaraspora sp. WMMD406 TaxID=3016095 RepID=UPI002415A4FA|nr:methyltransferase [Solwaraspora sp. WMMD406]MDG4763533.1 methyltransferase [Solwaraspora sp. WMMD406]
MSNPTRHVDLSASAAPDLVPDVTALNNLVVTTAPWAFQSLYVAAKLGLADALRLGSRSSDDLAEEVGAHPGALYRFCRALAALGILYEHPDRIFSTTAMGAALRSDAPRGLRHFIIVNGEESFRAWAEVMHSVRTGKAAFDHVYGMSHFAYLALEAEASTAFNAMAKSGAPTEAVDSCDFSEDRVVVDVGGGSGGLLAHILQRNPELIGILSDTPAGVEQAAELFAAHHVLDRAVIMGGSFFESVPNGGDSYILSRVIHDWNDEDALRILRTVHRAMSPGSRLILIDKVIPDTAGFHPGKFSDLQMLVVLGGQERTLSELTVLLDHAGFRLTDVRMPEFGPDSPWAEALIQAMPVDSGERKMS